MKKQEALRKLFSAVAYVLSARKTWRLPPKSSVLIYSAAGEQFLRVYLGPWQPEVLHVDGDRINVPILLASLFRRGANRFRVYRDTYIRRVGPKLIVTFVDNALEFYTLSSRHPGIKTLVIQNGIRVYAGDILELLHNREEGAESLSVNYMATFGRASGDELAKFVKGTVFPIGSLRNNMNVKRGCKTSGSIGFVSQFRNSKGLSLGGKFFSFEAFFERADRLVLAFLKQYSLENNKPLFVIPCSGGSPDNTLELEKAYYRGILGQDCAFSGYSGSGGNYETTDNTEVVVSIDSALGYESVVRGNKTAMLTIRRDLLGLEGYNFGWPRDFADEGPFWTNTPDPEIFKRILDHLFAINEDQWLSEIDLHGMSDLLVYDPGNGKLRNLLHQELGPVA